MPVASNTEIAGRLEEVARVLDDQGANPFRVRAYARAAQTVRGLPMAAADVFREGGLPALEALPGIGESLARSLRDLITTGRLPLLEHLRGRADPVDLLASVPGIGRRTADRLHDELGLHSLEDLELAAHDGRLASLAGFGAKRLAGVRDSLAQRLGRLRRTGGEAGRGDVPSVEELLDVDEEYRVKAATGQLKAIAPRRFNPERRAWLPILHTTRGPRHYTALFSNTARAHSRGATRDWVVLYWDGSPGEGQATVITAHRGSFAGRRIVRGREEECAHLLSEVDRSTVLSIP